MSIMAPTTNGSFSARARRALPSPLEGAFGVTLPEVGALPQPVIFACALPKGLFPSYASLADLLLAAVIAERKGRETAH